MKDFRRLAVWEKSHALALAVYRATEAFPRDERFGLTAQMRRAAVSVPSNIAEGCGRKTGPDFQRFLHQALGSARELEYQLLLSRDLGHLAGREYELLCPVTDEVVRMLGGLIRKVESER